MTSQEAKRLIVQEAFPMGSRYLAAITEGLNNADVLMARYPNEIIEYEIKISAGDFMAEIRNIRVALGLDAKGSYRSLSYNKYTKHSQYLGTYNYGTVILQPREFPFVPYRFYFAVPSELVDFAVTKVIEYKLPYGVVELRVGIPVRRPAKKLPTAHVSVEHALELFYRCFRENPYKRFSTQTELPLDETSEAA